MNLAGVETPAGLVDLPRARSNLERAAAYCRGHGIGWRPHVKTHKSLEMARLQLACGAIGLSVATPHEAEVMARVTDDLLVAHPPAHPSRIARLCALPAHVDVKVASIRSMRCAHSAVPALPWDAPSASWSNLTRDWAAPAWWRWTTQSAWPRPLPRSPAAASTA